MTYKVFKVFRNSGRRIVIRRGLSLDEARRLVNSHPNRQKSMVCFTAEKPKSPDCSHDETPETEYTFSDADPGL